MSSSSTWKELAVAAATGGAVVGVVAWALSRRNRARATARHGRTASTPSPSSGVLDEPYPAHAGAEDVATTQEEAEVERLLAKYTADGSGFRFTRRDVLTGKWVLYSKGGFPSGTKKPHQDMAGPVGEHDPVLIGCPFCKAVPDSSEPSCRGVAADEVADVLRFVVVADASVAAPGAGPEPAARAYISGAADVAGADKHDEGTATATCDALLATQGLARAAQWTHAGEHGQRWKLRVARNLYPCLSLPREYYRDGGPSDHTFGFVEDMGTRINPNPKHPWYLQATAEGYMEVFIEGPRHNECFANTPPEFARRVVLALRTRGRALRAKPNVKAITMFKQHKCGSLLHAHSQLITTVFTPSFIASMGRRAVLFRQHYGQCPVCATLVNGPSKGAVARHRLVFKTKHFVVSVPFAARDNHRLTVAPINCGPDFLEMSDAEVVDLGVVLRRAARLYYHKLDDVPFNLAVFSAPVRLDDDRERTLFAKGTFHWHVGLYPRPKDSSPAGFSLATDIATQNVLPEEDAAQLRAWDEELCAADREACV